ncbi:PIG-L deacetylase family protein [Motilibacter deserti]|uniref:PIG-L family deacetylase n=1 Tax=Motilibacter deserti TaxID=2714956 RepID=A0ABX0GYU3_9ACTN|nr:PIG-L deacetylase family protein [Motilibacter deserti]NHC16182.1 PIG-L family deacetylase [Motilibacter deserti]
MPSVPVTIPEDEVERALVIAAHPDDIDFGAAGTVALWTDRGVQVTYCICTDGDAGGFDPAVPRREIPGIRRAEQVAAAREVGVTDVRFLGYKDGRLEPTFDLRRDISRVIRQVRPQRAIVPSPEYRWDRLPASHPDHRAAGEAAVNSIYPDARNPFTHVELLRDEGLEAWTVREMWIMAHPSPDHAVDVTDVVERKLAALRSHVSQVAHIDGFDDFVRGFLRGDASVHGLPQGRMAEAFKVVACP